MLISGLKGLSCVSHAFSVSISIRVVPKDLQVPTKGARRVVELAFMRFVRERIRLMQITGY